MYSRSAKSLVILPLKWSGNGEDDGEVISGRLRVHINRDIKDSQWLRSWLIQETCRETGADALR